MLLVKLKIMFKKHLFVSLFVISTLVAPFMINAQTAQTSDDIALLIADLQRQIAVLKQQLAELQGRSGADCYTFDKNLRVGDKGKTVEALHMALEKSGLDLDYSDNDGNAFEDVFYESTAAAVSAFQFKYKDEILTPNGLTSPT